MYKSQLLFLTASLSAVMASAVTGCGGDDAAGVPPPGTSTPDANVPQPPAPPAPPAEAGADAGPPNAVVSNVTAYLGRAIALDGSGSTGPEGFTYAWTVESVPDGSAVTTASLVGADTATPSFVPDVPGAYVVKLTVTANGVSASAEASVTIVDPPIFYFHTNDEADAGAEASLNVVGAGVGTGGTAVACFERDAGKFADDAEVVAQMGADWWEAPAGQPSRAVFIAERPTNDGFEGILVATTSDATCATPPTALDAYPGRLNTTRAIQQPRFSPNGNRVAYIRTGTGTTGSRIATVGFDGSDKREVAIWGVDADGGPAPNAKPTLFGSRPTWVNDTTIAWVQQLTSDRWQLVSAPDQENAPISVVMTCTGSEPTQVELLPNGDVIINQLLPVNGGQAYDILTYSVDGTTKECINPRSIGKIETVDAVARDFSLSPDKTHVAFISNGSDGGSDMQLYVAPVDGSTPPVPVASSVGGAYRGPRWVGEGAFLTWGAASAAFEDAAAGNAVAVIAVDGGTARRAAAAGAPGTQVQAIGNGYWTCSFGPVVGSSATLAGLAGLFVLRTLRRRRR